MRDGGRDALDDDVKAILSDIYHTINDRLESSRRMDENVRKLEELGYKFSIFLEASILLTKTGDEAREAGAARRPLRQRVRSGSLSLDHGDLKYLKSLKIALDRAGGEEESA